MYTIILLCIFFLAFLLVCVLFPNRSFSLEVRCVSVSFICKILLLSFIQFVVLFLENVLCWECCVCVFCYFSSHTLLYPCAMQWYRVPSYFCNIYIYILFLCFLFFFYYYCLTVTIARCGGFRYGNNFFLYVLWYVPSFI